MNLAWFWVALWALGVIAFLVYFFRTWKVGCLQWVLVIVAFIASMVLQLILIDVPGYAEFVTAAEPVGRGILVSAATVLVADIAVIAIFAIRRGKPDDWKGDVDTANRGAFFQGPGSPLMVKRSKIKTLYSAGAHVQVKKFVDGTATKGEWLIFSGVFIALTAFLLVFVGVSLMLIRYLLFAAVLPIGAGHVLYLNVRIALDQYREAKLANTPRQRRN